MVLPLLAEQSGDYQPIGSCVVVGGGIALTAKHVVEASWRCFEYTRNPRVGQIGSHYITAFQYLEEHDATATWSVRCIDMSPDSDLAILTLTPQNNIAHQTTPTCFPIDLNPPNVGDSVTAFGYAEQATRFVQHGNDEYELAAITAPGVVRQVHAIRRDNGILNFPCFMTDAPFDHGMSGGAVVNSTGRLIGLISTSLPPSKPEEEHASYAALLWPAFGIRMGVPIEGKELGGMYMATELIERGVVNVLGYERISTFETTEGPRVSFK